MEDGASFLAVLRGYSWTFITWCLAAKVAITTRMRWPSCAARTTARSIADSSLWRVGYRPVWYFVTRMERHTARRFVPRLSPCTKKRFARSARSVFARARHEEPLNAFERAPKWAPRASRPFYGRLLPCSLRRDSDDGSRARRSSITWRIETSV